MRELMSVKRFAEESPELYKVFKDYADNVFAVEDAMAYASLLASDNILDNVGHTHISITVEQLFRGEYIEIEVKMVVQ